MNSPLTNADLASNGQVVVFPPDRGIGVLAVDPPYPPGYKPQSDGALGININMVHGDRDGLLVYILAYLNMAIGDYIKVYIETKNASVAEFSVTEAHFDAEGNAKNIPFYISAKDMEARFAPLLSPSITTSNRPPPSPHASRARFTPLPRTSTSKSYWPMPASPLPRPR